MNCKDAPAIQRPCLHFRPTWRRTFVLLLVASLGAGAISDAEMAARRERVAKLSAAEKQQLQAKQDRFLKLEEAQRARVRELHAAIEGHPRRDELKRVMANYRHWLRELTPEERAKLLTTEIDKRLATVHELHEKVQQRALAEANRRMNEKDRKAIRTWAEDFAAARFPEAEKLLSDNDKKRWKEVEEPKKKELMHELVWKWIMRPEGLQPPNENERQQLVAKLSAEKQKQYKEAKNEQSQQRLVGGWLWGAWGPMGGPGFRRGRGPGFAQPSQAELETLLPELPTEERQRLMTLSPDRFRDELRRVWWEQRRWGGPGGPGRGRPDGQRDRDRDRERGGGERGGGERGGRGRRDVPARGAPPSDEPPAERSKADESPAAAPASEGAR